jgi:hypothetical protein
MRGELKDNRGLREATLRLYLKSTSFLGEFLVGELGYESCKQTKIIDNGMFSSFA